MLKLKSLIDTRELNSMHSRRYKHYRKKFLRTSEAKYEKKRGDKKGHSVREERVMGTKFWADQTLTVWTSVCSFLPHSTIAGSSVPIQPLK
jgi:hypothetical protein